MGMRGGKQTKEQQELEGRVEAIIPHPHPSPTPPNTHNTVVIGGDRW